MPGLPVILKIDVVFATVANLPHSAFVLCGAQLFLDVLGTQLPWRTVELASFWPF